MVNKIEEIKINSPANFRLLNRKEKELLRKKDDDKVYNVFKDCALAVLCIDEETDDANILKKKYSDFDINIIDTKRGIQLQLINAPSSSFIDGKIIQGVREHLFSVLRDVLHVNNKIENNHLLFNDNKDVTDSVFNILRNTNVIDQEKEPNLVVCWGGHSINKKEYEYTKEVGYHLGIRGLDICTGCGMGAMKGPMKGAAIAHLKIRKKDSRFIGLSEPGIISSEAPNPIVNNLIIMPDIEKRLEAFVRLSHGIVIFPGGPGTAEELLYLVGVLLHPKNKDVKIPIVLSGSKESVGYLKKIDDFIRATIGEEGCKKYKISTDPIETAKIINDGIKELKDKRHKNDESYHFNWSLKIDEDFQKPFPIDHNVVEKLEIRSSLPKHELAANLRRLFSVIVAGNIKPDGVSAVKENGPFRLNCDKDIVDKLDDLLKSFVIDNRMKLPSDEDYKPCYIINKDE